MKEILQWWGCVFLMAGGVIFCLACLFSTNLFTTKLTSGEITTRALDCHRAGLQSYITERNSQSEATDTGCRGFD